MNDDRDVRRLLEAAVRHEPPLALDRDAVFREGRRRLRVRRTATVGGTAVAVAAVVIGMTALSGANFGLSDPVGPAVQLPAVTTAAPSPTSASATPEITAPVTMTTRQLPPREELARALREGPDVFPAEVDLEGEGRDWFAFDGSGTARFHLVADDRSRRLLTIAVVPDSVVPPPCPYEDCQQWSYDAETLVFVRTLPPAQEADPYAIEVTALRKAGITVRVVESAGVGPPWRKDPIMPVKSLVELATIPGFAVKR